MAVEEVFVVKANTGADAESFLELAQAHLESQKTFLKVMVLIRWLSLVRLL